MGLKTVSRNCGELLLGWCARVLPLTVPLPVAKHPEQIALQLVFEPLVPIRPPPN
jgi:hypothetical protein